MRDRLKDASAVIAAVIFVVCLGFLGCWETQAQDSTWMAMQTDIGTPMGAVAITPSHIGRWFRHEDSSYVIKSRDIWELAKDTAFSAEWFIDDLELLVHDAEQSGMDLGTSPSFVSVEVWQRQDSLLQAITDAVNRALAREDSLIALSDSLRTELNVVAQERDSLAVPAGQYQALADGIRPLIEMLNR